MEEGCNIFHGSNVAVGFIHNTLQSIEDYAEAIIRVYNNPICKVIDDYDTGDILRTTTIYCKKL